MSIQVTPEAAPAPGHSRVMPQGCAEQRVVETEEVRRRQGQERTLMCRQAGEIRSAVAAAWADEAWHLMGQEAQASGAPPAIPPSLAAQGLRHHR